MNWDDYVHPDPSLNCTAAQLEALLQLLSKHGVPVGSPAVELVPSKSPVAQLDRVIPLDRALALGLDQSLPVYFTFEFGSTGDRTTAGYIRRLFQQHGQPAMIRRLFLEHVGDENDWNRHLLQLPAVQRAVKKELES